MEIKKNYDSLKKKNSDFQNVYVKGKSKANRYLVMYVAQNNLSINRLGISVSKKVGNSVVRHHHPLNKRSLQTEIQICSIVV